MINGHFGKASSTKKMCHAIMHYCAQTCNEKIFLAYILKIITYSLHGYTK